jgi:hypothetical protein
LLSTQSGNFWIHPRICSKLSLCSALCGVLTRLLLLPFLLLKFTLRWIVHTLLTYLLTYLLTPWCRTLFEKLVITQSVKNILLSSCNPKAHHRAHKSPPLDPILSQPNPVRPIDLYLLKVQLNVIRPPASRSSQWSLTFGPRNQNPVNTSPLRLFMPRYFYLDVNCFNYDVN